MFPETYNWPRRVERSTHTGSVLLSLKEDTKRPVKIMNTSTEVWRAQLRSSQVTRTSTNQAAPKLTSFKKFSKLKLPAYTLQGSDGINQTWLNFRKSSLHNEPNNGSNSLINVTLAYRMCCKKERNPVTRAPHAYVMWYKKGYSHCPAQVGP
jgi:hypothetical protein